MNELIKVTQNQDGVSVVSARELYLGLELNRSNWSRWYPKNILNNVFFEENKDWIGVRHYDEGNEVQDFAITLDFAKHIAMMSRTVKSHEYRNYFIDCEKKLVEIANSLIIYQDSYMINDPVARATKWIEEEQVRIELIEKNKQLTCVIEEVKPKLEVYETLMTSSNGISIEDMSMLLRKKHNKISKMKLLRFLKEQNIIGQNGMPDGYYIKLGHYDVVEVPKQYKNTTKIEFEPYILPRGQEFVSNLVNEKYVEYDSEIVDLPGEIWKRIKGFKGYSISNHGRIKNKHSKPMRPSFNQNGKPQIGLRKDGKDNMNLVVNLLIENFYDVNDISKFSIQYLDEDIRNIKLDNIRIHSK